MYKYIFLFSLSFVWVVFAMIQDFKTTEIANWLTFSLIAFVLAYRAFYSVVIRNVEFFLFGLGGVLLFALFGYLFYYSKFFGGGDAKLLYGIGGIFPYTNLGDYIKFGLGFIFVLFFVGMIYTLIYTIFLVLKRKKEFGREFSKMFLENKNWFYLVFFIFLIIEIILLSKGFGFSSLSFFVLILIPFLYIYVKSVEKACMVNFVKPENLIEGDWLEREVKVNGKVIKKSVHGLSIEEIKILRKAGKKVLIKQGVPFTPAFLIAIILAGIYFFVL